METVPILQKEKCGTCEKVKCLWEFSGAAGKKKICKACFNARAKESRDKYYGVNTGTDWKAIQRQRLKRGKKG